MRAAALKRLRTEHRLTQEELATALDVSQGTLSDWERARKAIPEDRYARLLEVSAELGGLGPRPAMPDAATEPGAVQTPLSGGGPELGGDAPIRGNNFDRPPGLTDLPADAPPDFAALGADFQAQVAATMSPLGAAALPDVRMFYLFGGQMLGKVSEGAGTVVQGSANELALSLVQAAESNAFLARVVEMMRVGPVSTFVILHVTVALRVLEELRKDRALKEARLNAQAESSVPPDFVAPGYETGPIYDPIRARAFEAAAMAEAA